MTRRDRQAGVTLVEVLVTLSIIAVLAGLSILAFGPGGRGAAAEFTAERLADDLNTAALVSFTTGAPAEVDASRDSYRIRQGSEAPRVVEVPGGVRLSGSTGGTLRILPDGTGAVSEWRVTGARTPWIVTFDGLTARAAPAGG